MSVELIRNQLAELKAKVERQKAVNVELRAKLAANPEWIAADKRLDDAQRARIDLSEAMQAVRRKASTKILNDGRYVEYTKDYAGVNTNIRPEVLEAIKANLSITKLKASQVEQIARDLISMIVSVEDIDLSGKLAMAQEQEKSARIHLEHIQTMFYLKQGRRPLWTYDLEKEIKRLEEVLADPVKTAKEVERALIPSKMGGIYDALRAKGVI